MNMDDLLEEIRNLIEDAIDEETSVQVEHLQDRVEMLEEEVAELEAECQELQARIDELEEGGGGDE
mgnify:CR=1 FL=1